MWYVFKSLSHPSYFSLICGVWLLQKSVAVHGDLLEVDVQVVEDHRAGRRGRALTQEHAGINTQKHAGINKQDKN